MFDIINILKSYERQTCMNISYDYYRIFYYTAKYKSITKAAEHLFNNQPNITRTIKNLENELGCVLFIRSRQGVQLTPEGEKLFEHVKIAFEHIKAGEKELISAKNLQSGTVSIGASEIALHCLLLPVLEEYRRLYPKIRIRVSNHTTPQAISALKNGFVDIAVVSSPFDVPQSLSCTVIKKFNDVAVCGTGFSHIVDKTLSFSKIAQIPLICLGEQTKTYEFYSKLFAEEGVNFSPNVEVATVDQILPLVKINLGVGFVPEIFLENIKDDKSVYSLRLKNKIPPRTICFLKREKFSLNIAAQKLEEMIKSYREK